MLYCVSRVNRVLLCQSNREKLTFLFILILKAEIVIVSIVFNEPCFIGYGSILGKSNVTPLSCQVRVYCSVLCYVKQKYAPKI